MAQVRKRTFFVYFSPYAKIQCPLHLAPISKRIELQQRAWSQLLAFFETRILKKREWKSDNYYGSYDYKQVSVYLWARWYNNSRLFNRVAFAPRPERDRWTRRCWDHHRCQPYGPYKKLVNQLSIGVPRGSVTSTLVYSILLNIVFSHYQSRNTRI